MRFIKSFAKKSMVQMKGDNKQIYICVKLKQLKQQKRITARQRHNLHFFRSPAAYNYMRQNGIILPAISTIKKWLGNFRCEPGFNRKAFTQLSLKAETMKLSEKVCLLIFDEMVLKRKVDYNQKTDTIEGLVDLGNELGRRPVPANLALVIMIRGIYANWKMSLAYFVTDNGVSAIEH